MTELQERIDPVSQAKEPIRVRVVRGGTSASNLRWFAWIALVICLFSWKTIFTHQFSILTSYENANQAYAWYNFAAQALHHGALPLWDPFTHSGSSFPREMQTALFYPPKLILYLWPFNHRGLLSTVAFHYFVVLTHIAAAWFMFLLARESGLRRFPAFVAAIVFSLGGFVGRIGWPNMLDSAIWLPLEMLLLHRALRAEKIERALVLAGGAGMALGFAILAGSLHVVIMQGLATAGFLAYRGTNRTLSRRAVAVAAAFGIIAAGVGAVQLLPSMEYSSRAIRYLGGSSVLPASRQIPYGDLHDNFEPRSIMAFLIGFPFNGASIGTGECSPYFGVLPLLLAVLGAWRNWRSWWVRFLSTLALLAFYYTLGEFSLLHGILYATVPFLSMAREAGRFIYLTHFAMAILAGFGAQSLLQRQADSEALAKPVRIFGWFAAGGILLMAYPALTGKMDTSEWAYNAVIQFLCAYALLFAAVRGWRSSGARATLVILILADLFTVNWTAQNVGVQSRSGQDYLQALADARPMAEFLRARRSASNPGPFRVHIEADWAPNIGDLYGIETTGGKSATELRSYAEFLGNDAHALDLLNVRYIVRPSAATQPGWIYRDAFWKVYQNPTAKPRAWLTAEMTNEESIDGDSNIQWLGGNYGSERLRVRARTPGTLALSELDYPGWRATVNGRPAAIRRVDGLLRAVDIPGGDSLVEFRYAPHSMIAGGCISLSSMIVAGCGLFYGRKRILEEPRA